MLPFLTRIIFTPPPASKAQVRILSSYCSLENFLGLVLTLVPLKVIFWAFPICSQVLFFHLTSSCLLPLTSASILTPITVLPYFDFPNNAFPSSVHRRGPASLWPESCSVQPCLSGGTFEGQGWVPAITQVPQSRKWMWALVTHVRETLVLLKNSLFEENVLSRTGNRKAWLWQKWADYMVICRGHDVLENNCLKLTPSILAFVFPSLW